MGVLRDTDRQKGIPFCVSDVSVELMAQKWPTVPTVATDSERRPLRTTQLRHQVTRAEKDSWEQPGDSLVIPWKWKALLGFLRCNSYAPVYQPVPKGKEVKVTGKKAEESAVQSYWGGGGQETMISVLFQPLCAWHSARKLSCRGHMHLWPDPFHAPLILTQESSFGRHPNGF